MYKASEVVCQIMIIITIVIIKETFLGCLLDLRRISGYYSVFGLFGYFIPIRLNTEYLHTTQTNAEYLSNMFCIRQLVK